MPIRDTLLLDDTLTPLLDPLFSPTLYLQQHLRTLSTPDFQLLYSSLNTLNSSLKQTLLQEIKKSLPTLQASVQ